MVEDLKLSPKQAAGMTSDELDAAFTRWQVLKRTEDAAKQDEIAAAQAKLQEDTAKQQAETQALLEEKQAEGQLTLDSIDAEYRTKVARATVSINKDLRQTASNGQAAIIGLNQNFRSLVTAFNKWSREQDDRMTAVQNGLASARAEIERKDAIKNVLGTVGLQAATPYLPTGLIGVATALLGLSFGKKQGEQAAGESTRALLSSAKQAGVLTNLGQTLSDHAEPADIALIQRLAMQDGISLPVQKT